MWWKQNKWKVIVPVLIAVILAGAFWFGGSAPGSKGMDFLTKGPAPSTTLSAPVETPDAMPAEPTEAPKTEPKPTETSPETPTPTELPTETEEPVEATPFPEPPETDAPVETSGPPSELTPTPTESVAGELPTPAEPENAPDSEIACTCTISISCATILNNLDDCDSAKVDLVPADGWILTPTVVTFYEGESVFNVLQRVCKQNKIHMEYTDTPMYNSAYIEGIHNLYEFDVGELSGWMYKVNEWFPNYGCSRYGLKDGDIICWVYTCDLGNDVGGGYSAGQQ